jgi:hypothetical protein
LTPILKRSFKQCFDFVNTPRPLDAGKPCAQLN